MACAGTASSTVAFGFMFLMVVSLRDTSAMRIRNQAGLNASARAKARPSNVAKFPDAWNEGLTMVKEAGKGAFGAVYIATVDCEPSSTVAIKYSKTPDAQTVSVSTNEVAFFKELAGAPFFMGLLDTSDMTSDGGRLRGREPIQYWSDASKMWIRGTMTGWHPDAHGKVKYYDVTLEDGTERRGVVTAKVRKATREQELAEQDLVRFWSNTYQTWLLCRVQKLYYKGGVKVSADILAVDGSRAEKAGVELKYLMPFDGEKKQWKEKETYMLILMEAASGELTPGVKATDLTEAMTVLDTRNLLKLTLDAIKGVAYMHSKNFLHRDIKPDNILISRYGAKVADFGLACDEAGRIGTEDCQGVGGTPTYMSPEVWNNLGAQKASDVWALALILWEVLFPGQMPRSIFYAASLEAVGAAVRSFNSPPGKIFNEPAWAGASFVDKDRVKGIFYYALHPDPSKRMTIGSMMQQVDWLIQVEYGAQRERTAMPYSPPDCAPGLVAYGNAAQSRDTVPSFTTSPGKKLPLPEMGAPARRILTPPAPQLLRDAPPPRPLPVMPAFAGEFGAGMGGYVMAPNYAVPPAGMYRAW